MSIIGKKYAPFDNSYVIDCETKTRKLIVQGVVKEKNFSYSPSQEEIGATYEIVSEPYEEWVHLFGDFGELFKYTFINVKSSKSGNTYRTLYDERRIA